jgi:hypothetical protein
MTDDSDLAVGVGKSFTWNRSDARETREVEFAKLLDAPVFQEVFNEKFIEGLER